MEIFFIHFQTKKRAALDGMSEDVDELAEFLVEGHLAKAVRQSVAAQFDERLRVADQPDLWLKKMRRKDKITFFQI